MIILAAVDQNGAISWQQKPLTRISEDMRRFRSMTEGGTIVCDPDGLRTFPDQKPLPNRHTIVYDPEGTEVPGALVIRDWWDLLDAIPDDACVAGGESLYRKLLPYCSDAILTRILHTFPADAWFPAQLETNARWKRKSVSRYTKDSTTGFKYRIEHYLNAWPE